jgi:DNA polymerase
MTLVPRLVVALGATAAQSLIGRPVAIGANRCRVFDTGHGVRVFVTVHPSSLLRAPDEDGRRKAYADFVNDLKAVAIAADPNVEIESARVTP